MSEVSVINKKNRRFNVSEGTLATNGLVNKSIAFNPVQRPKQEYSYSRFVNNAKEKDAIHYLQFKRHFTFCKGGLPFNLEQTNRQAGNCP